MADDSIYLQQRQKEQEILKTTEQFSKKFKNVIGNLQEVNSPLAKTIADLRETTKGSFKAAANAKELQQFTTKIAKATSDSADTTTKSYKKLSEGLDRLSGTSGFLDQLKVAQDNYNQNHANAMKLEQEIAETEFKNRKSIQDFRDKIAKLELDRIRAEGLGQEDNLKKITTEKEKQEKALTKFETKIFDTKREELEIQKNLLDTSKSNLEKLNETVDKQAKEIADQDTKFTMFGQGLKELTGFDLLGTLDTVVDKVDAVGKIFGNKDLSGSIASAFSFGGKDDIVASIAGDSQEIDPAVKIARQELKETEGINDGVETTNKLLRLMLVNDRMLKKSIEDNAGKDGGGGLTLMPGALLGASSIIDSLMGGGDGKDKGKGKKGKFGFLKKLKPGGKAKGIAAFLTTALAAIGLDRALDKGEPADTPRNRIDSSDVIEEGLETIAPIAQTSAASSQIKQTTNSMDAALNADKKVNNLKFKSDGTLDRRTVSAKTLENELREAANTKRAQGDKAKILKENKLLLKKLYKATGTNNIDDLLKSPKFTKEVLRKALRDLPLSSFNKFLKIGGTAAFSGLAAGAEGLLDYNDQVESGDIINDAFDLDLSDGTGSFNEEDTNLINSALEANKRGSVGKGVGWFTGAMLGLKASGMALEKGARFVPVTPNPYTTGGKILATGLGMGMSYLGGKFGGDIGDTIATADLNAQTLQQQLENISYQFTSDPDSPIYQNEKERDNMAKAALERYKNNIPLTKENGNIGGELQNQKNEEVESKVRSGYYRNKGNIRDKEVAVNSVNNNITQNTNHYGKSSFYNPDDTARILDVKYS
jgi:hypothetical protein